MEDVLGKALKIVRNEMKNTMYASFSYLYNLFLPRELGPYGHFGPLVKFP